MFTAVREPCKDSLRNCGANTTIDVFIDVPDDLDLGFLRGNGLIPSEQALPEEEAPAQAQQPAADQSIVSTLMDMGFPRPRCVKAAVKTSNQGMHSIRCKHPGWVVSPINGLQ